jgi:hypothetical protein
VVKTEPPNSNGDEPMHSYRKIVNTFLWLIWQLQRNWRHFWSVLEFSGRSEEYRPVDGRHQFQILGFHGDGLSERVDLQTGRWILQCFWVNI